MILLDFSSIAMSVISIQLKEIDENPDMVRHMIFNIVRRWNLEFREEYGELVLCYDSKNNWRRDVFPQYKAGRRKSRRDSVHDWDAIFEVLGQAKDEMKRYSPYRCLEIERCEADDIIGTICKERSGVEPILIISPDRDFVQLQRYPNVQQYSNIQKKWITPEVTALIDLENKILAGDKGDGVPNVLTDDNAFVDGGRQTPLNKRKKQLLMEDPEMLGTSVARRIIRNRNMIDLARTPQDLQDSILSQFDEKPKGSITGLLTLFTKQRMNLLAESLPDFEVKKLINRLVIT